MNSTVSLHHIPPELVVSILEYYILEITSKSQFIPLLLVSKTIYNCIIPKVYHALTLVSRKSRPPHIDCTKLFANANPSNFLYVRRLASVNGHTGSNVNSFAPFTNLTHLFLAGTLSIWNPEALGIPNLPLEELIMWNVRDRQSLFKTLSPKSRLSFTLRKFGTYEIWTEEDFAGLEACTHLTHLMVHKISGISAPVLQKFMRRPYLLCWLLIPGQTEIDQFSKTYKILEPLSDPRIVVVKVEGSTAAQVNSAMYFWNRQSTMWEAAETSISQNSNPNAITVLDILLY
ncbi:hypothetical protein DL96DRAFT_542954 [Flagelloscypha sp. PMI_526]|nr:hypothetical protein DL96DRAFT_542954 [Flagelloscypha sp. PMI_526]